MNNKELDVIYAKVFTTSPGKQVLDNLVEMTIDKPIFGHSGGLDAITKGIQRSGENDLVRYIINRVKRGKDGNQ